MELWRNILYQKYIQNCVSLESIPELNIKQMCDYEFENCSALKDVHLHEGLANVGYHYFANYSALEDLYVPDTVKFIYDVIFKNCVSLKTIHLPDNLRKYQNDYSMDALL